MVTTMCWVIANRETSLIASLADVVADALRIRSDSLNGWFRLPCPTNIPRRLGDS